MKIFFLSSISIICISSFSYAYSSEETRSFRFSDMYQALNPQVDWRLGLTEAMRAEKKSEILEIVMRRDDRSLSDWQSDSDYNDRRVTIIKIVNLLKKRKPNAPQYWLAKLPLMAKRLEIALYSKASSRNDYLDATTLKRRLTDLATEIVLKTSIEECNAKIEKIKSDMSIDTEFEDQKLLISIFKHKDRHHEDEIKNGVRNLKKHYMIVQIASTNIET
ncbi:MAG: hypothetical protein AB8G05_06195 [Oligoflexales bacterium]